MNKIYREDKFQNSPLYLIIINMEKILLTLFQYMILIRMNMSRVYLVLLISWIEKLMKRKDMFSWIAPLESVEVPLFLCAI
jgi:hypothetical protein